MKDLDVADHLYKKAWDRVGRPKCLTTDSYVKFLRHDNRNVRCHVFCSFPIVKNGEIEVWSVEQAIFSDDDIMDINFWIGVVNKIKEKVMRENQEEA